MNPERIQRKRTAGWRMPPNTVSVCRPGPWGNPFKIGPDRGAAQCVQCFRTWLETEGIHAGIPDRKKWILANLPQLQGKNLACWCAIGSPCHADVLIELANTNQVMTTQVLNPAELSGADLRQAIAVGILGWKWAENAVGKDYDGEHAGGLLTIDGKPKDWVYPPKGPIHPAYHVPDYDGSYDQALSLASWVKLPDPAHSLPSSARELSRRCLEFWRTSRSVS